MQKQAFEKKNIEAATIHLPKAIPQVLYPYPQVAFTSSGGIYTHNCLGALTATKLNRASDAPVLPTFGGAALQQVRHDLGGRHPHTLVEVELEQAGHQLGHLLRVLGELAVQLAGVADQHRAGRALVFQY